MEQLFLTLKLDLTHTAPEGAGWYVSCYIDSTPAIAPIRISSEGAHVLSGAFHTALQSSEGEMPQVGPQQLVASGERFVRQALEEQLRYAEEQAAKAALLRRRLGQTRPASPQVQSTPPVSPQPRPIPQVPVPLRDDEILP